MGAISITRNINAHLNTTFNNNAFQIADLNGHIIVYSWTRNADGGRDYIEMGRIILQQSQVDNTEYYLKLFGVDGRLFLSSIKFKENNDGSLTFIKYL